MTEIEIGVIVGLVMLFIGSAISSTTSTLKNNFTVKGFIKPMYITTFLDSCIFSLVTKGMISGTGIIHTVVYALGRVAGSFLARVMEKKMALGILEVDVLLNQRNKALAIADELRDIGYSVESMSQHGYKGQKRILLRITINKKELHRVRTVLSNHGYINPTLKAKELDYVEGKFTISYNYNDELTG